MSRILNPPIETHLLIEQIIFYDKSQGQACSQHKSDLCPRQPLSIYMTMDLSLLDPKSIEPVQGKKS